MIITHYQYSAESMLDGKSFEEGALYFIEDTQHVYLDPVGGSERIRIASDINILASEADRENLLAPIPGKMYFVLETSKYYIFYGDTWYAGGGSNKPRAGLIYINPGSSLPEGFLWCDGATYSRSDYPELFAAIVPICGGGFSWNAAMLKNTPVWAFHCVDDGVVPCWATLDVVEHVKQYAESEVKLTIYPENSHDAWTSTYQNQEVYDWLLKLKKE
jgi:hypothetical protein